MKARQPVNFARILLGFSRLSLAGPAQRRLCLASLVCCVFWLLNAPAAFAIPADDLLQSLRATADVNDFAGILTEPERAALEEQCRRLRDQTGAQLSVVVLKSLQGGQIDDFAVKLFEKWKIGQGGKDNGVLLLVAIDDRKARIEVGYGLEPVLPDILAGQILREDLFPAFRQQQYAAGLQAVVQRIIAIIERNEPAAAPLRQPGPRLLPPNGIGIVLLFLIFLASPPSYVAGNLFRFGDVDRAVSQLPLPGFALLASILLGMPWVATLLVAVAALVSGYFGFLSDTGSGNSRGRRYRRNQDGRFGGPWGGSGSGWGGGGFSGGGGESWGGFGGGRSGGGGASGGW